MKKKWMIVLLIIFFGLFTTVILLIKKYNENKYVSDLMAETDAEVLDWDPTDGTLSLKFPLERTVTKSRAKVEFPGTMVRLSRYVAPACAEIMYELIEGVENTDWPDAFKPGDKVNVSARNLRLQKDEIPQEFVLSAISNETPRLCEE